MIRLFAIILIAAHAHQLRAQSQFDSKTGPAECLAAAQVGQPQMLGLWRVEFEKNTPGATLLLEKNANYADSFSGAINRGGQQSRVAGDVEDGQFTLEESADGVRISATWSGDVVEGSCGREIRGIWQPSAGQRQQPFVMRKQPAGGAPGRW